MKCAEPFAVPAILNPQLAGSYGYWASLRRGSAEIPFTDDLKPGALANIANRLALLRVFHGPLRFRFSSTGQALVDEYGIELDDRFLDEISCFHPFEYSLSQACACVERGAPAFYRHNTAQDGYVRLMLPFWGEGEINALLVVFGFGPWEA